KNQLIEAVRLAKQKGFAIAIGHPRKNTFKALEQSKDLLKSVELVYLSEIYAK
ncbi:TPA: divergent polysaccharide deacetylase family protein, partial [Campylobacter coli]|nr:divergent polysaccharide deacetylase family protein [Campylobacter coli]